MLAEPIIRMGRAFVQGDLPIQERIRWLTDVDSENCKNYFQNVFVIELSEEQEKLHIFEVGNKGQDGKKQSFNVNLERNIAFPFFFPNGGNPLNAQGSYPLPCYLMWDPHIKKMNQADEFINSIILPRFEKTITFREWSKQEKENLAQRVASILKKESERIISIEKQLGILMIYDSRWSTYKYLDTRANDSSNIWIRESGLYPDRHMHIVAEVVLEGIYDARFEEASSLGERKGDEISSFSNKKTNHVVSIYNKSWLWLSPTWDLPKSIWWEKDEWVKGIKVDRDSYIAYLFGTQFLKKIQSQIVSRLLKEMFAPTTNVEAKKNMKPSSFEPIYGIPMLLPILEADPNKLYEKYQRMLASSENENSGVHLEAVTGLQQRISKEEHDNYRLTLLYYSGDMSRGDMHIRAVIEDVLPSVIKEIDTILDKIRNQKLPEIQRIFQLPESTVYRIEQLPALLANAYGPGYIWNSLQAVLHRQPLTIDRLRRYTIIKLNELANKKQMWDMRHELVFYFSFISFLKQYNLKVLQTEGGMMELTDWKEIEKKYYTGEISLAEIDTPEKLGFITGLLLKQFSDSYWSALKLERDMDFIQHRVLKFGRELTPEKIWKKGLMACGTLEKQWKIKLSLNFNTVLAQVLLGMSEANNKGWLIKNKDEFMTTFWAGYFMYKKPKDESNKEDEKQ